MPRLSNQLSRTELIEHRRTISKKRPSLPAKASKSFTIMYQAFRAAFEYADGDEARFSQALDQFAQPRSHVTQTYTAGKQQRTIRITATAKPELDHKRYAQALLALAEQLSEERMVKDARGSHY